MINLIQFNDVVSDPEGYVNDILSGHFYDIDLYGQVFRGIQPINGDNEFSSMCLSLFKGYEIAFNFIRKSPLKQDEPNYIHTDEMMGDITCLLYLNKNAPDEDGTIFYDSNDKPLIRVYSKFNSMVAFNADVKHSRSMFDNFGEGDDARLIQVIFLKQIP